MADVGSAWMPDKQPKSAAHLQLRLVADELYTVATARVRGATLASHSGYGRAAAAGSVGGAQGIHGLADPALGTSLGNYCGPSR